MDNNHYTLKLRSTELSDLDILFNFQADEESLYLAAFTSKDPTNKCAYIAKYSEILKDPYVINQTILMNNVIVGSIAKFVMDGNLEVTYWLDRKVWGRGVASKALKLIVKLEPTRPIFARVAFDNFGSQKVLEKCGFIRIGNDEGFANARQEVIQEFIYKLA